MIDTDKYEGHAPAPWVVIDGELYQRGNNGDYHLSLYDEAVAQLIADAPLLLDFIVWVKNTHPHYYHRLTEAYETAKKNNR
jgi:hypothetical protein